jgi:uncharacterized protein
MTLQCNTNHCILPHCNICFFKRMKLHPNPAADLAVTQITANSLTIANTVFSSGVQVGQAFGAQPWGATSMVDISEADIAHWAAQKPELVILGSGSQHRFLAPKLAVALSRSSVGLECMNTGAAARTYNVLLEEGRNVIGAFVID